jgi:hypothetical protein
MRGPKVSVPRLVRYASKHYGRPTDSSIDDAEAFAFHFMRPFLVESPRVTPRKIGLFLIFGKMGRLLAVKR